MTLAVRLTALFPAVPLATYPAVTLGVTDTVLLNVSVLLPVDTVADDPLIVAGAVALPLGMALICTLDSASYPLSGVIVCEDVVGLMFVFA